MPFHREQHNESSRIRPLPSVFHVFVTYVWVHVCVHVSACLEIMKVNVCACTCVYLYVETKGHCWILPPASLHHLFCDRIPYSLWDSSVGYTDWPSIIVLEILLSLDRITRTVPCLAFRGMIGIQIQVFMLHQQALYRQLSTQPYKFIF